MGLIFDIIKFFFSSDFRDSVKSVFKLAKSSGDWKKDILIYKGEFDSKNELKVQALIGQACKILTEKGWDTDSISSISYGLTELVKNGIEHSKSDEKVLCKIEICSNYCTIEVTDKGVGFDLSKELQKQNALDENSRSCKALGVIYRMMTNINQTKKNGTNIISATVLKGYKSCRVYSLDDITVFEFNSEVSFEGYFWTIFINTIKSLKVDDKVVIYFNDLKRFASMAIEVVNVIVYPKNDEPKIIHTKKEGNIKSTQVVICGNNSLNYVLRNYLNSNYEYFQELEQAIEFLKTGKKPAISKNVINISPSTDWTDGINEK